MRYSAEERRQIARGEFFTAAELHARPWLGRTVRADIPPGVPRDPNTRPVTAAERAAVEAMTEVCAYCYEPGDDRSALVEQAGHHRRHPECEEAWQAELAARRQQ